MQGALLFAYFLLGKQEKVGRAAAAARNPRLRRDKAARNATIRRGRYWMTRFARPFGAALRAFFALRARPACAGMTSRADAGSRRMTSHT